MPGLVPGIHVLVSASKIVDGRDKPGHDGAEAWRWPPHFA
ncbi:ABC transporter [Bradyrhizobium frederickii]|uniref:ABC transporter n=1 Tax=Bradyrhizobium frederickii TaxID=2560054 RepID=A0A4Y9P1G5_9BRAD|nr:MAG: ABC transporter [Bradyrhizobiaceae bacterium]TFV74211.1 ABC transporter [Bradyrhizobium frederickii]